MSRRYLIRRLLSSLWWWASSPVLQDCLFATRFLTSKIIHVIPTSKAQSDRVRVREFKAPHLFALNYTTNGRWCVLMIMEESLVSGSSTQKGVVHLHLAFRWRNINVYKCKYRRVTYSHTYMKLYVLWRHTNTYAAENLTGQNYTKCLWMFSCSAKARFLLPLTMGLIPFQYFSHLSLPYLVPDWLLVALTFFCRCEQFLRTWRILQFPVLCALQLLGFGSFATSCCILFHD